VKPEDLNTLREIVGGELDIKALQEDISTLQDRVMEIREAQVDRVRSLMESDKESGVLRENTVVSLRGQAYLLQFDFCEGLLVSMSPVNLFQFMDSDALVG
jgi:hypothetical protein